MTVLDEFSAERDAMIAQSHRGVARDDGKTSEDWAASLRKICPASYGFRRMWIKIGAVALRAVEAHDRAEHQEDERARRERQEAIEARARRAVPGDVLNLNRDVSFSDDKLDGATVAAKEIVS